MPPSGVIVCLRADRSGQSQRYAQRLIEGAEARPAVVEEPVLGIPFLPSLGVRWRF